MSLLTGTCAGVRLLKETNRTQQHPSWVEDVATYCRRLRRRHLLKEEDYEVSIDQSGNSVSSIRSCIACSSFKRFHLRYPGSR